MEQLANVEPLESGSGPRSCVEVFKISCIRCHHFLMEIEAAPSPPIRMNCKAGECRIFNQIQLIEEDGYVKLVQWPESKPRNVRF